MFRRLLSRFYSICGFFVPFVLVFLAPRPHPGPGSGPTPRPEARPGGSKKGFFGGPKRGFSGGSGNPKRATGGILPTGSLAKNRVFRGFFRGFWGIFGVRRTSGKGVGPGGGRAGGLTGLDKLQLVVMTSKLNSDNY